MTNGAGAWGLNLISAKIPESRRQEAGGAINTSLLHRLADRPIYLMDNHCLAAYCWNQELSSQLKMLSLLHIDAHADWGPCGLAETELERRRSSLASLNTYLSVQENGRPAWQWDSYFSPYLQILAMPCELTAVVPHWEDEYFTCPKLPFVKRETFDLLKGVVAISTSHQVVNIDIDAFCSIEEGERLIPFDGWEERVKHWAPCLKEAINTAQVVTIALSPTTVNDNSLDLTLGRSILIANHLFSLIGLQEYDANDAVG